MIQIVCKESVLSYWGVRYFLNEISYSPLYDEDYLTLHLLNPFEELRKKASKISLTDSIEREFQLRFFLENRVKRRLNGLAVSILERYQIKQIFIYNAKYLDEESKVFFCHFARKG